MLLRLIAFLATSVLTSTMAHARGWLYEIDPVHTQITFFVDHLGFSRSSGRAYGAHGHFVFQPGDWSDACVVARVPAGRISFGDPAWDLRMQRSDYFDTASHPEISFHSTRIETVDESQARVHGMLELRGSSVPIVLELTFNKAGQNIAAGRHAAGFSARAALKRSDFGITALLPRVGDDVNIVIEAEGWRMPRSPGQTPRCESPESTP